MFKTDNYVYRVQKVDDEDYHLCFAESRKWMMKTNTYVCRVQKVNDEDWHLYLQSPEGGQEGREHQGYPAQEDGRQNS